uniref:lipid IVA 3-deoxy-D-manno-octulosonic acid transferase n=2 Tax=Opuntia streptacantha TaxID=393608 RepID=A0A7C9AIU9_OPUST
MAVSESKITLALINARMSVRSFQRWSMPAVLPLITLMLSKFSLIVPLSTTQAIHFQLLQVSPFIVSFSADLKYSVGECATSSAALKEVEDLRIQLKHRPAWMASSIHKGEDEVMLRVHRTLAQSFPNILTIIVPRHAWRGPELTLALKKRGLNIAVRSDGSKLTSATNIYVIDTLGELKLFYRLMPIAVIGGSFLPSLAGHNVSEAAAAACAVLTGPHVGHFVHMVSAMQQANPLSILQVSGELELIEALRDLLSNQINLEARQSAAKQAFLELSSGTLAYVWEQLNLFVLGKDLFEVK